MIVLLIVVAIIALLMVLYLPSVLQMYSPPTTEGEEGTKKPVLESVKERLEGIGQRNKRIDDFMNQQTGLWVTKCISHMISRKGILILTQKKKVILKNVIV